MATDFLRRMFANILIDKNMIILIISGSSIDEIENTGMELLLSNKYYLLITLIFLTKYC